MIDAARHFQPVDVIKRNLDGLAAMKMNVFHWHLVDDQGWRIEMKKLIATTRMFGKPVFELRELREAVATYITRAAEKLRRRLRNPQAAQRRQRNAEHAAHRHHHPRHRRTPT